MICPRCGIHFARLYLHREKCGGIPTPTEMARRFRNDKSVTMSTFRKEYNASDVFVKDRLIAGGVSAREIENRAKGIKSQNNRRASRQQYQRGKRVCAGCEVLLDHPKVPEGNSGFCKWCISEDVPEKMAKEAV